MKSTPTSPVQTMQHPGSAADVLWTFLKLGVTSFGGPVAHLGYFRREFVERRRWLDDAAYTDLIGVCQLLPGPTSSQAGFSIGLLRAGWAGGLAAWCGFTLPSVLLMLAFAMLAPHLDNPLGAALIHGLKLTAVAVVAQAVTDMARKLCPDRPRAAIALVSLALLGVLTTVYAQLLVIVVGAVLGVVLCRVPEAQAIAPPPAPHPAPPPTPPAQTFARRSVVSRGAGAAALGLFCALLFGLPAVAAFAHPGRAFDLFASFFRSGALVFGGGHVVLPLLQQATVGHGWLSSGDFLAGYGAAQALPGPLFAFAAYLGWLIAPAGQAGGALLATVAIFLPGMLLVLAVLPYWHTLRARPVAAAMLDGVNAAVVGLLAAALYSPVWTSAVLNGADFAIAAAGWLLLTRFRTPPLAVVALCVAAALVQALPPH